MIGFIKKDLYMIKSNIKLLMILLFVYLIMAFQGQVDVSFLLPFMSVMIMISTFSYDTYNKWDAYVVTMPNGRKNSVRAKYLATIILIVITTIIITLLSFGVSYIKNHSIDLENMLATIFGSIFATILLQSIFYPAMYKFGPEKARIGIFVVVFGIVFIGGIVANYINLVPLLEVLDFIGAYWNIVIPIAMILMICVSYKISERIYLKKEM